MLVLSCSSIYHHGLVFRRLRGIVFGKTIQVNQSSHRIERFRHRHRHCRYRRSRVSGRREISEIVVVDSTHRRLLHASCQCTSTYTHVVECISHCRHVVVHVVVVHHHVFVHHHVVIHHIVVCGARIVVSKRIKRPLCYRWNRWCSDKWVGPCFLFRSNLIKFCKIIGSACGSRGRSRRCLKGSKVRISSCSCGWRWRRNTVESK
mmetsp:Transcript_42295/g.88119  ORF Transcript_42295/g.88119 Transcript_42295/m.88119 type:complete len:205 (-) Transcript_42295:881-1495(-)